MSEDNLRTFTKTSLVIFFTLVFIFFWFILAVIDAGVNNKGYDDHPSIYDDEWQKDMYGGTDNY